MRWRFLSDFSFRCGLVSGRGVLESHGLSLLVIAVLALMPLASHGQGVELVAVEGDLAPDTGGGTLLVLGPPDINDAGQVVFQASYDLGGGGDGLGVFVDRDGTLSAVALEGDPAPGTGGGLFAGFLDPVINASGQIAFVATWIGGTIPGSQGVFVHEPGGGVDDFALISQVAPDTGGGTYANFLSPPGLTDAGEVIVNAGVFGGSASAGVFELTAGADRLIVANGDPAPAPLAGSYFSLLRPGASRAGEIAFFALIAPSFSQALVRIDAQGAETVVALQGALAPDTSGGSFSGFALDRPAVNDAGQIGFHAFVSGGSVANGVFLSSGAVLSSVALPGEAAPGTGGGSYGQPTMSPTLDGSGRVGFRNDLAGAGAGEGLFLEAMAVDEEIALTGDDVPGLPGSVYDEFPTPPAQSPTGLVAFHATTAGTTAANGIWTVPEPVSGTLSSGILVLVVLARGSVSRRRERALDARHAVT